MHLWISLSSLFEFYNFATHCSYYYSSELILRDYLRIDEPPPVTNSNAIDVSVSEWKEVARD